MIDTDNDDNSSTSECPNGDGRPAAIIAEMAEKTKKARTSTPSLESISEDVYRALPDTIGDIAYELNEGHERDTFLTGVLPVLAGGLPNARFRYGGQQLSLNLYTAVVAPAGSGKGKMKHAQKIGRPLDKDLRRRSRQRLAEWKREKKKEDTEDPGPKPQYQRVFLAADASAASMKESLNGCPHAVVFETEFKTLSTALGREWGQFRDVLLKGFQNESVEVDRKSEEPVFIEHPAPSMAVSGTPGTFSEVIGGLEDGLFSRFAFYQFDSAWTWTSQFEDSGSGGIEDAVGRAACCLRELYQAQTNREEPIHVTFGDPVKQLIDNAFRFLMARWEAEGVNRALCSSMKRAAVRASRIAAIMHLLRLHEDHGQLGTIKSIDLSPEGVNVERDVDTVEVGMQDAVIGLRLALTYLLHAVRIAGQNGSGSTDGSNSSRGELHQRQRAYLDALPEGEFPTEEAKTTAEDLGIPPSTARNWVERKFKENGHLEHVEHGVWRKAPRNGSDENVPRGHSGLSGLFRLLDADPGLLASPWSHSGDGAPPARGSDAMGEAS